MRYARRIPSTGPTGLAFFGAYLGAMVYGFYQVGQGNARRRGLKEEKLTARAVLIPFLQAEEDRRYAAAAKERRASEDKIMSGVPGCNRLLITASQGCRPHDQHQCTMCCARVAIVYAIHLRGERRPTLNADHSDAR